MISTSKSSVAIILVNWNGYGFTSECLQSLKVVDFPNFKVFVVDNASENQEGEKIKIVFPEVELLQNNKNLGFAGGNNVGIRAALKQEFSHVLLLNNDTVVESNFLAKMMAFMDENPALGIVQPLIYFLHDREKIWSAGGRWSSFFSRAVTLGDRKKKQSFTAESRQIDWATGCALLISSKAIQKIGLLNEQYFTYFEDVDWSIRASQAGFGIGFESEAVIYHEAGASSKKQHSEGTLSAKVFYYHCRNQFLLIRRFSNWVSYLPSVIYHSVRFFAWMGYFCLRGRFQKLKAVVNGIRDGLTDRLEEPARWP